MDIRVQELLDRIKKDGVESAEAEAARIRQEAESRRDSIVAAAEKEARAIVERAKADAARMEESGKAALVQASRDLLLAFRGQVEQTLGLIVKTDVEGAFDADVIKKALPAILEAWARDGRDDLTVLLPAKDLKSLDAYFRDKLAGAFKKGLEIKPLKDTKAGFRIAEKGGAVYYDFSAASVADMIGAYLNARLASIVAEATK